MIVKKYTLNLWRNLLSRRVICINNRADGWNWNLCKRNNWTQYTEAQLNTNNEICSFELTTLNFSNWSLNFKQRAAALNRARLACCLHKSAARRQISQFYNWIHIRWILGDILIQSWITSILVAQPAPEGFWSLTASQSPSPTNKSWTEIVILTQDHATKTQSLTSLGVL